MSEVSQTADNASSTTSNAVLYVYYKVPTEQHGNLAPRVRAFQAQMLSQWPGLSCELLQRPQASNGVETWMETYHHQLALTNEMTDSIEAMAVASGLPLPRHCETFVPLRSA
jgi:hypothetical protein